MERIAHTNAGIFGKHRKIVNIKARFVADGMDAMNAAKCGYIDNVIEPEYVRQYVISALQMLN